MADSSVLLDLLYAEHAQLALDIIESDAFGRIVPGERIKMTFDDRVDLGKFLVQKELEIA